MALQRDTVKVEASSAQLEQLKQSINLTKTLYGSGNNQDGYSERQAKTFVQNNDLDEYDVIDVDHLKNSSDRQHQLKAQSVGGKDAYVSTTGRRLTVGKGGKDSKPGTVPSPQNEMDELHDLAGTDQRSFGYETYKQSDVHSEQTDLTMLGMSIRHGKDRKKKSSQLKEDANPEACCGVKKCTIF